MPEANQVNQVDEQPDDQTDPGDLIAGLIDRINERAANLRKHPPRDTQAVATQLSYTVLDLVAELAQLQLASYLHLAEWLSDIEDRVVVAEQDVQIAGDDLRKISSYIEATMRMLDEILARMEPGDVKAQTESIKQLGAECLEVVQRVLEADDGEEGEEGEEEESKPDQQPESAT